MLSLRYRDSFFGKLGQTILLELDNLVTQFQALWSARNWVSLPWDGANYAATAGNWTVTKANQQTLAYRRDDDDFTLWFDVRNTNVSTNAVALKIKLPPNITPLFDVFLPCRVSDAGATTDWGMVFTFAGDDYVYLATTAAGTLFTNTTSSDTTVQGSIRFAIKPAAGL